MNLDVSELLGVVGAPLLAAIVGGFVVHVAARRRDVQNERRRQRVDYLVGAYRTLAQAAQRDLRGQRAESFEDALADVILLGTDEQIRLVRDAINALADNREAPMDALLISLRNALRRELNLPHDALQQVPVVRIMWGTQGYLTPLKVKDTREVTFDEVANRTGAAVASAAVPSVRSAIEWPGPETNQVAGLGPDVQMLRDLALAAPGAAVATAYGQVTTALQAVLSGDGSELPDQFDAPTLAQAAADRGLVSHQFVKTVQGLAVLKDLGIRGGAGTGLSVDQANEYIALAAAALYVLSTS